MNTTTKFFYLVKPLIPRWLQIYIRQRKASIILSESADVWPIDEEASKIPDGWKQWPENKQFALVLTHDVELKGGCNDSLRLAKIEKAIGFRSCFSFVPERYHISEKLLATIRDLGFELAVHGLKHDGKLFSSQKIFLKRSKKINYYLKSWNSKGFYSPSMHHNIDLVHEFNIIYDQSTFDTDPFEPQPIGVGKIFPFVVESEAKQSRYIELPYTLPQDHTLFIVLKMTDISCWKTKLDWIAAKGGMALIKTHPDYMSFDGSARRGRYPVKYYIEFLEYVKSQYGGSYWHVLPYQMAEFWNNSYSYLK